MAKEKPFLSDKVLNRALKIMALLISLLVFVYLLTLFSNFFSIFARAFRVVLVPLLVAWLLSLILYPAMRLLEKQGIRPRPVAVGIVFTLFLAFIAGFSWLIIPPLSREFNYFFETDYPLIVQYFSGPFRDQFLFGEAVYEFFLENLLASNVFIQAIEGFATTLGQLLPNTLIGSITYFIVLPILLLFYLLDYENVNHTLTKLWPKRQGKQLSVLGGRLNTTVGAYIRGQLLLMLSFGAVSTILFRVMGIEYFYFFGLLVGLLTVIPYFGVLIAMLPVALYTLVSPQGPNPFVILGMHVVLQFIEANVFQPIIIGQQIKLHPMLIILSILFFGSLFGIVGILFAAPLAATTRVLITFFLEQREDAKERIRLFKEEAEAEAS